MAENFTIGDFLILAEIQEAINSGFKVRWEVSSGLIADGLPRLFTTREGYHFSPDKDIREAFLWISGLMEYWVPVTDVMSLFRKGLFVVQKP